jgi:hypothetical protein
MSADHNDPAVTSGNERLEVPSDIEFRLTLAQVLNQLLHGERVTTLKRVDAKAADVIEAFVRANLRNLLLEIMGERRNTSFSDEEVSILRMMVNNIKGKVGGKDA